MIPCFPMTSKTLTRPAPARPRIEGYEPSPAGPVDGAPAFVLPPVLPQPPVIQTAPFVGRTLPFLFAAQREFGETFAFRPLANGGESIVVATHPDHVKSLFSAPPEIVPSITSESPLRPVLGPRSVLILNGPEHLRRRKLLLPP